MGTVIIGTLVFAMFGFSTYNLYKDKKSGNGCSGNCAACRSSCKITK